MGSVLLVSASGPVRRVALVEHGVTREVFLEPRQGRRLVGNVYLGRVQRVLPGMQSAFVDIGLERTAFLFAGDLPGVDDPGKPPPIGERIKRGQTLVVQVAKEPIGTKGARITTNITLPGRFIVYMPTVEHVGVSRRITDECERERLRTLAESMCPEAGGLIVRTVGEGASEEELREDLDFLVAMWADVERRLEQSTPPTELHRDLDVSLMATRDLLTPEFDALCVDDPEEFDRLAHFLEVFMPRCRPLLGLDTEAPPLFARYGVDRELSRALGQKVWLRSGGSIVIDQTEALTAIDVNTGRYVGKSSFEDTVLKINLEAVEEIAYQLRLRNIGGIIVIDFIDMERPESQQLVHDQLIEELARDKVRTRVLPMSALGLIEMTRKRVRSSLRQQLATTCDTCDGRGWLLGAEEVARRVLGRMQEVAAAQPELSPHRDVAERAAEHGKALAVVKVTAAPAVVDALLEDHGETIEALSERTGVEFDFGPRAEQHIEMYEVRAWRRGDGDE